MGGIWSGAALGASSGDSAILGGLVFSPDGAQLLFINGAGTGDAALWGVDVTRASELGPVWDLTGGHPIVDTSLADGGIDLGPGDRLYYKTWNDNDLGEVADPLGTAGVPPGPAQIREGPIWSLDQLRDAHRAMDENRANGKMVVVL